METVLETKDLTKQFSGKTAVSHVDMEVHRGDIYGFIGKNGAGKTTLIRMAVGLAAPTSGSIRLMGSDHLEEQRRKIGTVIEYPAVFPHMTAKENMEAQCRLLGVKNVKKETDNLLEIVGLGDTGKKKARNFSLGMKQRLAIALALIGNPEFLCLDEPTNGLDPAGIVEVRDLIQRLNRERQITVLISSHILGELSKLATRYGIIHQGRMLEQFTAEELEERCRSGLEIHVDNREAAVKLLHEQFRIADIRPLENGGLLLPEPCTQPALLNQALVQAGIMVDSLHTRQGDLEHYFMQVTSQAEAAFARAGQ